MVCSLARSKFTAQSLHASVHVYAATHSTDPLERQKILERALPVKIGKNCWMYVFLFIKLLINKWRKFFNFVSEKLKINF